MAEADFPKPASHFSYVINSTENAENQQFAYTIKQSRTDTISSLQAIATPDLTGKEKILYLLDLDDTLFLHPFFLGSRTWRTDIKEQIAQLINEDPEVQQALPPGEVTKQSVQRCHDLISYILARTAPIITVENQTKEWIQSLQEKGHVVSGLTARERNVWFYTAQEGVDALTANQLQSLGIDLEKPLAEEAYPHLVSIEDYAFGIHFSPLDNKGDYFEERILPALIKDGIPDKIVFVDDKLSHVESMADALRRSGIHYECYHYAGADARESAYDPLIANIQLFHFWKSDKVTLLSDAEAQEIARKHPERDAQFYLKPILLEVLHALSEETN